MLTLIVIPVVYTYMDDIGSWVRDRFVSEEKQRALKQEREEAGLATPEPAFGD
jgi:HAE1 family hydrophobic/amphiphilic exporter-1